MCVGNHKNSFDWMSALDYFTCRRGHGMPLDPAIAHLEVPVYTHICNRYRHYLTYPRYIANFTGLMVHELCSIIADSRDKPFQLHIYSGHDINILGLLYVLGATIIHPQYGTPYYWPDFGTTLALEVCGDSDIRVFLNAEPCALVRSSSVAGGASAHRNILTLDELLECSQTFRRHTLTPDKL